MKPRRVLASLLAPALLVTAPLVAAAQPSTRAGDPVVWKIDASHSELTFEIRHLVSRVQGTFKQWEGTLTADPSNWSTGSADIVVQTASITTNNDRRDADLRSSNFFAADSFPTITFKSTRVEVQGSALKLYGDLTMRGVTRPVVMSGELLGTTTQRGKRRVGFAASTTVNRLDWGITWNRAVEGGGVLLGDEVKIEVVVAAVEQ